MADTLKRLEYFTCLAEIEHYGKAAEKLGIAQSALSQQIKALELEVGFRLFQPAGRGICLSAAGRHYHQSVIELLENHKLAIEKAKKAASGEMGKVTISHVGTALLDEKFLNLLKDFRRHYPAIEIQLIELAMPEQLTLLRKQKVDLAIIRGPYPLLPEGTLNCTFSAQRLCVAMSPNHPLASRQSLSMKDLENESFVSYQEPDIQGISGALIQLSHQAGFNPRIEWRVSAVNNSLGLVNAWMAVSLVPENIISYSIGNVVFRPLEDANALTQLIFVWNHDQTNPVQKLMTDFFRNYSTR